jgi:hypothetical protein
MRFRCNHCSDFPRTFFEWEGRGGECPQCGRKGPPAVAPLADVHLVVQDDKGPIMGQFRQRVACQPKREFLGRSVREPFHASDDPRAVTCPKCRGMKEWQERAMMYEELEEALASLGVTPTMDLGEVKRDRHTPSITTPTPDPERTEPLPLQESAEVLGALPRERDEDGPPAKKG